MIISVRRLRIQEADVEDGHDYTGRDHIPGHVDILKQNSNAGRSAEDFHPKPSQLLTLAGFVGMNSHFSALGMVSEWSCV